MNESGPDDDGEDLRQEPSSLIEQLYDQYYDRVYRTAYRITKNHQDALDVCQETFLKALVNAQDIDTDDNVGAWLAKIAHNNSINHVTSKAKKSVVSLQDAIQRELSADKWPRFELSPSERQMLNSLAETIMDKTDELSDQQQKIFSLYYLKQLDTKEIAQKLDISASTVRVHLHRASKGLRKMLGTDVMGGDEEDENSEEEE